MDTHTTTADAGEAYRENRVRGDDRSRYASEISSSLSLQVLLYYNGLLSAVFFVLEGGLMIEKVLIYHITVVSWVYQHDGHAEYQTIELHSVVSFVADP